MDLSQAIDGYWLDKRRILSPRTARDYELAFRRLMLYLGDIDIASITADDIRRFLGAMRERHNLSAKSVINLQIALASLWTWAVREVGVSHVVRGIARPRWNAPPIEPLTRVEVSAMLAACETKAKWKTRYGRISKAPGRPSALRDKAILLVLLDTGMRAGELCALKVRDLDTATGRLLIRHGKGDKARPVYLGANAQRAIWRYLSTRQKPKPNDPIFTTRSGAAIHRDNLGGMIKTCAARAGIERNIHTHMFRHTFAITFLRNGGNLLELQALLGHASMDTLKIYARLAQIDLQAAAEHHSPADRWNL